MKKKLTAVILSAAVGMSLVACSPSEQKKNSKYTIEATLAEDYTLSATVTCKYVNNTDVPLGELWFHLYPNAYRNGASVAPISDADISAAYPNGRSYADMQITAVTVGGSARDITISGVDENILTVPLGKTLEPTDSINVKISYTLKLPNVSHRLGYTDKSVNLGNFYPIACVYKDGAFVADPYYSTGDPFFSECADYTVRFSAPEKWSGAFTGSVKSKSSADGVTTYNVSAKNVRDFCAVFGEYQKMSGLAGSTIVNYYYYDDGTPEASLNTSIDAVNTFSKLFGEYPYAEYTVVQTSFLHGGMEYPCLSMISDKYSGDSYKDIIIHETAHQWWYGAVGNNEVKYAWLDEALAEYSTMMFYEVNTEGYSYTFNGKRADAMSAYVLYCETYKEGGMGDTSMTRAVNEYANDTEYSYMTYVKGALMLDDVRNSVGSSAFKAGLKRYYSTMKFEIAEPQDLVGAMEKSSKRRLSALFDSWLKGDVKLFSKN
ncbi:MAG: M1 family metallopeptidase [Clostridiales bacterium]|nr:M1 family metallopeptidase [Clostridiales bacterium]